MEGLGSLTPLSQILNARPRPQTPFPKISNALSTKMKDTLPSSLGTEGLGSLSPSLPTPLVQNLKCVIYEDEGHNALFPEHGGLGLFDPLVQNFNCLTYEDEGHAGVLPGHGGLGLFVPLALNPLAQILNDSSTKMKDTLPSSLGK